MLRPAGPDAMAMLRVAAYDTDAELDWALMRVGILAPVELGAIRSVVTRPAVQLIAMTNRDGHCIVEVVEDGNSVARIHHDGQVVLAARAAA
jgi:hypothetical protein